MLVTNRKKQKGITLIELMISMMLGLIVIGGALSIYISTIRGSTDITNSARLNYDLESSMQLMVNDIRRAGYWGGAIAGSNANNNPFVILVTNANITIPIASCILYTYDFDDDTVLDLTDGSGGTTEDTSEFFGFKLDNGAIKIRSAKVPDNSADCRGSGWETITDENKINITGLTFSFSAIAAAVGPPATPALAQSSQCFNTTTSEPYTTPCSLVSAANLATGDQAAEARQVNIVLTGEVNSDDTVIKSLTATVKVRNNRIFTQP